LQQNTAIDRDDEIKKEWIELVKEFSKISDRFLFDWDFGRFLNDASADMVCDMDEERKIFFRNNKLPQDISLIMDATSIKDLADKIVSTGNRDRKGEQEEDERLKRVIRMYEEGEKKKKVNDLVSMLKNKIPYLQSFFGLKVGLHSKITPAQLALLHILFLVENKGNKLHQGLLDKLLTSSFLRFYPNNSNYYEHFIFIRSCLLQKITFQEAYCFENVKGLICFAVNGMEKHLLQCTTDYIKSLDEDKGAKLDDKIYKNIFNIRLLNCTRYLLAKKRNKKYTWDDPVSCDLSDAESVWIEAYFHFIKLGIRDVVNEPVLPGYGIENGSCDIWDRIRFLNNEEFLALRNTLPDFSYGYTAQKSLLQLRDFIMDNVQEVVHLIADDDNEVKRLKTNVKNHCNCYINLCNFMWRNSLISAPTLNELMKIIYLFEKCCSHKVNIQKNGFRGGEPKRRTISMKTILLYFNFDYCDDIQGDKLVYGFEHTQEGDFADIFYGIMAFCNTIVSISNQESGCLIKERKKMKRALYRYFNKMIPLLKQNDDSFCLLSDYVEEFFPTKHLRRFCLHVMKNM